MNGVIYLITNLVTGKQYVGQTIKDVSERMREHIYESTKGYKHCIFHNSIEKHGVDNFKVEIICECSAEDLNDLEIFYINKFNTMIPHGYNMTSGGGGIRGYKHTSETVAKLKIANSGRVFTKERNDRIRQAMLGRHYKQEWKDKLSALRKGRFTKFENGFYQKHHSEETKKRISQANSGRISARRKCVTLYSEDICKTFDSSKSAWLWLKDNNYTIGEYRYVAGYIGIAVKNNTKFLGFFWRRDESVETISKESKTENAAV